MLPRTWNHHRTTTSPPLASPPVYRTQSKVPHAHPATSRPVIKRRLRAAACGSVWLRAAACGGVRGCPLSLSPVCAPCMSPPAAPQCRSRTGSRHPMAVPLLASPRLSVVDAPSPPTPVHPPLGRSASSTHLRCFASFAMAPEGSSALRGSKAERAGSSRAGAVRLPMCRGHLVTAFRCLRQNLVAQSKI